MFKPRAPRNHSEAWAFTCINLFATPGLGSIAGRRFKSGAFQLSMSITGFLLIMWWFFAKMRLLYGQMYGTDLPLDVGNTAGLCGLFFFGAAWIWSLITSVQLIKSVKQRHPLDIPPKIL